MTATLPAFQPGDNIAVENGRSETLYRGKVLEVDGSRVRVSLPAADKRPFVFDLASEYVTRDGSTLFTAW